LYFEALSFGSGCTIHFRIGEEVRILIKNFPGLTRISRIYVLVFLAIAFFLMVFSLGSCQRSSGVAAGEAAFNRVMSSSEIRVGYISYPPSFIKDPNTGAYSGIFNEVLQQAAKNLELKVNYAEEVGWGTMVEAVASGRVDLVCTGIWPTAGRARRAEFTTPLYFSPVRAYVRVGDNRFDKNLSTVNNSAIKIAMIDGEMSSIIAQSDFPRATPDSLPQSADISQLLLEVTAKKADLTFVEVAVAEAYIAKNPNSIRAVSDIPPIRVFPNVMMVGKGEFKLLSMLNVAFEELANNGLVDQAISKYEKFPNSLLRRQLPYQR
jgi:polar amino acid transport system substrate-binding protein